MSLPTLRFKKVRSLKLPDGCRLLSVNVSCKNQQEYGEPEHIYKAHKEELARAVEGKLLEVIRRNESEASAFPIMTEERFKSIFLFLCGNYGHRLMFICEDFFIRINPFRVKIRGEEASSRKFKHLNFDIFWVQRADGTTDRGRFSKHSSRVLVQAEGWIAKIDNPEHTQFEGELLIGSYIDQKDREYFPEMLAKHKSMRVAIFRKESIQDWRALNEQRNVLQNCRSVAKGLIDKYCLEDIQVGDERWKGDLNYGFVEKSGEWKPFLYDYGFIGDPSNVTLKVKSISERLSKHRNQVQEVVECGP